MTGGGSGGGGNSVQTQSGPPPQVLQSYQDLVNAAKGVATQPLNLYQGPMVAGFSPQQQQAFSEIGNAQGIGSPYMNAAAQFYGAATSPLWPSLPKYSAETVNQYLSPYTQDVTKSLTDLYNTQNQQQQQQIQGNAALRNAYGGDREAVAQALTAGQQQLAQAPTLAQVQQQGFQQAVGEFNAQQQQQLAAEQANAWLNSQAGFGMAGLGTEAQNQALTGANALLGVGGLQQKLAQEQLNIPYQQFLQTQAYPYQNLSFLSPIIEGTGSLSGGTGKTTYPSPSMLSQIGGLGLAGLGLYGMGSQQGWWGGGGGGSGPTDLSGLTYYGGGGDFMAKKGGRIGYADGGIPSVPGIGSDVPEIDLSYIPTAAPGGVPSSSLSPFQSNVTQTSSGGGDSGGGIGGALGAISSIAKIGSLFFDQGGRVGYDDGGMVNSGTTANRGSIGGIYDLPEVPKINLDFIAHPGPAVKGEGPPKAPSMPQGMQDKGILGDVSGLASAAKGLKGVGLFGDSSSTETAKDGGGIGHFQMGGGAGSGVPLTAAIAYGGAPPNQTQAYQQLMEMPLDRLQQMAVQFPPNTQQGQLVARAISQKKATVGAGTAQTAPAQQSSPMTATGLGTTPQQPQQDTGGTSHLADGGVPGFVTEDELDPYPEVDHSGDTVKVHYPSEGKVLDLGLPSIKPRHMAAGGSSGSFPHAGMTGGQWGVADPAQVGADTAPALGGGPAHNAPLLGTAGAETGGPATPFLSSLPTAGGVAIPQLSGGMFAPPTGVSPGGGIGNWFAPLDQYHPPGYSAGPEGVRFPSSTAFVPQMSAIYAAFAPGATIPPYFGGPLPGAASSAPAASSTPADTLPADFMSFFSGNTGSDKRGGRVGFDDGGEVVASADIPENPVASADIPPIKPSPFEFIEPPPRKPSAGDLVPGGALSKEFSKPRPASESAPFGLVAPSFGELPTGPEPSGIGNVPTFPLRDEPEGGGIGVPFGPSGGGIGEPSPPEAMATPKREPIVPMPALDSGKPYALPAPSPAPTEGRKPPEITSTPGGQNGIAPVNAPATQAPAVEGRTYPGQENAQTIINTARDEVKASPAATQAVLNQVYYEGGFADPWHQSAIIRSDGTREPSFGHWQLYAKGELPGYQAFLKQTGLPQDSHSQTLYVFNRAEQLHPGFSQIQDPKQATDILNTAFERYAGAAPGQRYENLDNAAKLMAGDFSALSAAAQGRAGNPSGVTGVPDELMAQDHGGLPVRQVAATTPVAGTASSDYTAGIKRILDDIEHRSKSGESIYSSPWLPVIAAGLGMMASRSPFPGVAFGEGGLEGIKMLQQQQAQLPKTQLEQAKADLARLELGMLPLKMQSGIDTAQVFAGDIPTAGRTAAAPAQTPSALAPIGSAAAPTAAPVAIDNPLAPATAALGNVLSLKANGAEPAQVAQAATAAMRNLPQPNAHPGNDPILAEYDRNYAALKQSIVRLAPFSPEKLPAMMEQYQKLFMSDPRNQALAERLKAEAKVGPAIVEAGGKAQAEVPAKKEFAQFETGQQIARKAGETAYEMQPYEVALPGGAGSMTLAAPRSQVLAGTAPGQSQPLTFASTAPQGPPATQNGRFDPDPESLIPVAPPPGVTAQKIELSDAAKGKLAEDHKTLEGYRKTAQEAPLQLTRLNDLSKLLDMTATGRIAEAGQGLAAWAYAMPGGAALFAKGAPLEHYNPANMEQVNKLATQLVFAQIKQIGGRVLVSEIEGLSRSNPNVALTPEANRAILQNVATEQQLAQDRYVNAAKVFSKYKQLGNFDEKYIADSPAGEVERGIRQTLAPAAASTATTPNQLPTGFPANARLAPDNHWYVPNPNTSDTAHPYLRVVPGAPNPAPSAGGP